MLTCIGIGPGDPSHLTIAAKRRIENADVIAGFKSVLSFIDPYIGSATRVTPLTYKDQTERLKEVAAAHHAGKDCVVAFMGDIHFSGFQLLERVERACGHRVERLPGISAAQMLASRCNVCFDETSFVTFHRRGDLTLFLNHLVHVLQDRRHAIVVPRPWDFMPKEIAEYLIDRGISPDHPTEVWENLTGEEASWQGTLNDCRQDFSDMSLMLIRAMEPVPSQLNDI